MREGIAIAAFTERGRELAEKLRAAVEEDRCCVRGQDEPLSDWTKEQFSARRALLFIGASGIAVRAIAPYLAGKEQDPAVLVLDEDGRHVIPLLSGHLGGANALALKIASLCGAEPVITTATDLRGLFAADLWAKAQNMHVLNPGAIRNVSGKILRGETIRIFCEWPVSGDPPSQVRFCEDAEQADVLVTLYPPPENKDLQLCLVPRVLTLGIGCKKNTGSDAMQRAFRDFCGDRRICPESFVQAASADRKEHEAGLLSFCKQNGWPIRFFRPDELEKATGVFTASAFVKETLGVDNVCERSAVLCSGGALIEKKYARDGITFAVAATTPELDWRTNEA